MNPKFALQFFLCCLPFSVFTQSALTENTLALDASQNVAGATIEDFSWLAGRWVGTGFGGTLEEIWAPAMGGTMVATFRLVKDDAPSFYEICLLAPAQLAPAQNTIEYKVKHFNPDFTGWEEKDEYNTFQLVKITENAAYFHGLTLLRDGDTCTHYLAMKQKDGTHKEAELVYHREQL